MKKSFSIFIFYTLVSASLFAQKKELNSNVSKSTVYNDTYSADKTVTIELKNGITKTGKYIGIDEENGKVLLGNTSDTTSVGFEKVYNVHGGTYINDSEYDMEVDAPRRLFYTPMGNTMNKGMFSLENVFLINFQLKYGVTDRLELGGGFTFAADENSQDSVATAYMMASVKYKVLDRRHLKVSLGLNSIQLPPLIPLSRGSSSTPWFNIISVAANWEYKYMTFSFAAAQGFINDFPLRQAPPLLKADRPVDYMVSASASFKILPYLNGISENIFFAGAWNVPGSQNTIDRKNLFLPLVGARYFGENYTAAIGFSNLLIPNAIPFFYIGAAYYFY